MVVGSMAAAAARLLRLPPPPRHRVATPRDTGVAAIWASRSAFRGGPVRKHRPSLKSLSSAAAEAETGDVADYSTAEEIRAALYRSLQDINRGIFGVKSAKKSEIENLVKLLESQNPTLQPTDHLEQVRGRWKLVYSTITILGIKRTKLGLRDFVTLGDFFQTIDVAKGKAINEIQFGVRGFKMLSGQLTVVASYMVSSKTRVDIRFESSDIAPEQLMNLFQKNYDLLLAIFNPEGWLEITYVDESMRIGRDDKGNIFILERTKEEQA